jgi:hypothetical protein
MTKPADLPYFPGKNLAIEARDRGLKVTGFTSDIKEPMLIGLIQIVEELRDEIRCLKEQAPQKEKNT